MSVLAARITDLAAAVRTKINAIMPRLLPPGGAVGSVLRKASGADHSVEWAPPAGGQAPDVQVFDTSGTWTKPAGAVRVELLVVGAGGGGASGIRNVGGPSQRAAGGSGAGFTMVTLPAAALPASVSVTVGAPGAGGAPQTVNGNTGIAGADGGKSSFGAFASAEGGAGTSVQTAPANRAAMFLGNAGGTHITIRSDGRNPGAPGGGAGGLDLFDEDEADYVTLAGAKGWTRSLPLGGTALTGADGEAGPDGVGGYPGGSGTGGASKTGTNGGAGGAGGRPGGGGGGGGATDAAASGAGGLGGAGRVTVITHFS